MFDPYKKWLGIPPKDQPPNHYRLLSLELYESDLDVIEGAADRVMGFLRQYQSGENAADAAKLLNEVATARICLLKPASKVKYDEKLLKQLTVQVPETSVDGETEALASLAIDEQLSDLPIPPRRKRTPAAKKTKTTSSSNPPWIPIGSGAGVVVLLSVLMLRPSAPRNLAPDFNSSASAPAANPAQPVVESKASPAETTAAAKGDTVTAAKAGTTPDPAADPVTAKSTESTSTVTALTSTTPSPSEQPKPKSSDAAPQKLWGAAPPLDPSIVHSDYLAEDGKWGPQPYCLSPSLVETPNGLVAAFVSGSSSKAPDVGVWITRSPKDYKWSTPVMVANGEIDKKTDPNLFPCGNPVLFQYSHAELALSYRVGAGANSWRTVVKFSVNHGASWGIPQILPEGFSGPTKTKPYVLPDKTLLCGCSTQRDEIWQVHFELFDGKQWTKTPPINDGKTIQIIEPALLFHGNDRWQAIGRSNRRHGKIYEVWSNDAGKSWGEVTFLDMPNPSSSIDAIKLQDGRFVMIHNHSATKRTPLCVAFSNDGRSWQAALTLEHDDAESSHPTIIQTKDGRVHVAYCRFNKHIRHCVFDPQKVRLKPIVDGEWPTESINATFREEGTSRH